jgi:hypothetical protein
MYPVHTQTTGLFPLFIKIDILSGAVGAGAVFV